LNANITLIKKIKCTKICQSESCGPDSISYCFIINIGKLANKFLLKVYNNVWNTGVIPKEWKKGIIIPNSKPGKNKHSTEGYRPITFLNRKIINRKLIWLLEKTIYYQRSKEAFYMIDQQ